jgi:hypothetical protein
MIWALWIVMILGYWNLSARLRNTQIAVISDFERLNASLLAEIESTGQQLRAEIAARQVNRQALGKRGMDAR